MTRRLLSTGTGDPGDRHRRNSGLVHTESVSSEEAGRDSGPDALTRRPPSLATRPGVYLWPVEEHREGGRVGEAEYAGAAGGGEAVVREQPFGFQGDALDDVRLRAAAGGLPHRF